MQQSKKKIPPSCPFSLALHGATAVLKKCVAFPEIKKSISLAQAGNLSHTGSSWHLLGISAELLAYPTVTQLFYKAALMHIYIYTYTGIYICIYIYICMLIVSSGCDWQE